MVFDSEFWRHALTSLLTVENSALEPIDQDQAPHEFSEQTIVSCTQRLKQASAATNIFRLLKIELTDECKREIQNVERKKEGLNDILSSIESAYNLYDEDDGPESRKIGKIRTETLAILANEESRLEKLRGPSEKAECLERAIQAVNKLGEEARRTIVVGRDELARRIAEMRSIQKEAFMRLDEWQEIGQERIGEPGSRQLR